VPTSSPSAAAAGAQRRPLVFTSARELMNRYRRQLSFAVVGLLVMAFGFVMLAVLIGPCGINPHLAYLVQALVSVELSFLLSRYWTWRDRRASSRGDVGREWLRFHTSRLLSIPANQALFSLLLVSGCDALVANGWCVTATTVFNYSVSHRLVFHGKETK
jgi:putative flippase GtrA